MAAREGSQPLSTRLQLLQTYDILIVNAHRQVSVFYIFRVNILRGWPSVRIAAPFFSLTNDNIYTSPGGGPMLFNIMWLYSKLFYCNFSLPSARIAGFFFSFKPTLHLESSVMMRCLALLLTARHPKIIPS